MEILIDSLYSIVNYKSRYLKLKEILEGIPVSEYKVIFKSNNNYKPLDLEVPYDNCFVVLKHPVEIDFNNLAINIVNHTNTKWMFYFRHFDNDKKEDIIVTPWEVDTMNNGVPIRNVKGRKLLIIKDLCRWTRRTDSGDLRDIWRKDAILIEDGILQNKPVAPYDNSSSAMSYYYYDLGTQPMILKNLCFKRMDETSNVIGLVSVCGQDNVIFDNIEVVKNVKNPVSEDKIFDIQESYNVVLSNININDTYSSEHAYGYAFAFDTITNLSMYNINAYGMWGVMGTNNLNNVLIKDCELNRFDIHCYGRDVRIINCTFKNEKCKTNNYNQLSSFYGTICFDKCTFINFQPLLFEPSFHTYTGFNLIMNSCVWQGNTDTATIINAGRLEDNKNVVRRKELTMTCWPNIYINDLILEENASTYILPQQILLFNIREPTTDVLRNVAISHISHISVNFHSDKHKPSVKFCNYNVRTESQITTFSSEKDALIIGLEQHY